MTVGTLAKVMTLMHEVQRPRKMLHQSNKPT